MQLVLVDSWQTECLIFSSPPSNSKEYLRIGVNYINFSHSNQYADYNDEAGNAIVDEILGTSTHPYKSIHVLLPTGGKEKWSIVSGSIFENLQDRFPDPDVEVSVHITCSLFDHTHNIVSMKGRKVGIDYYICTGSVDPSTFKGVMDKGITSVHCKLVVDIPDKSDITTLKPEQLNDFPTSRKVLEDGLFSDVTISAGSGGVAIKTHKCFLSASSPVLKKMFENEMKESKTGKVDMDDASERGVRAFLRYLYYGDMEEPKEDIEVAFELLSAAHKYDVRSLETEMVKCLLERTNENFTVKLAFRMYMFVRNIETAVELKKKTIQIMKDELDELESLQEYKDLFEKPSNSKTAMELCRDLAKTA